MNEIKTVKWLIPDVSTWQPACDWTTAAAAGIKGAIIRCGFGRFQGQKDNMFETHYKGATTAGVPLGVYHYSYAKTVAQAVEEAKYCLSLIAGKSFIFPVYFDIEDRTQSGLDRQLLTDMAKAFCQTIDAAGYRAGVYANLYWMEHKLYYDQIKQYSIWVAQYYKVCQLQQFYGMWQYTSTGKINGIPGKVDCNWCYVDYPALIKSAGLNGYKPPSPTPKPQPSAGVKEGDKVTFTGGAVYASSDAVKAASSIKDTYSCKVTYTAPGAKHPYHLEGGKVCGWVDASSVKAGAAGSTASSAIKKGDKVRIRKGAADYNGKSLAAFVYGRVYPVDELKGDRAVLDLKGICTAFNVRDLIKQ